MLTGLSGSGKSQAIRALEDLGYFCVDNLPVMLLPMLAELTLRAGSEIARAAVVVDVREGKMLEEFPGIFRKLKAKPSTSRQHSEGVSPSRTMSWSAGRVFSRMGRRCKAAFSSGASEAMLSSLRINAMVCGWTASMTASQVVRRERMSLSRQRQGSTC